MGDHGHLVIVCGLPGSGKTTHARHLVEHSGGIRFSPDEWMIALGIDLNDEEARAAIEGLQWDIARDLLQAGHTAIIEWGTWARSERDALRGEARRLGASVELHYLDQPFDVLLQRVSKRGAESPPVTADELKSWWDRFEAPDAPEMMLYDSDPV